MSALEAALDRLGIPELWEILRLEGRAAGNGKACRSPFRKDRHPSFSIYDSGRRWKDHATGEGGDAADFVGKACGLSAKDAARKLIAIAGLERDSEKDESNTCRKTKREAYDPFRDEKKAMLRASWPPFETPTHAEIEAIAELRGLSVEGISLAAEMGLLFCTDSAEGRAWVVTDSRRINAQARRLDGELWAVKAKKALTLPGSVASWPIGLREAASFPAIALVEGGPDLFAGFHLAWCAGLEKVVASAAMLGASNHIPQAALPLFVGKRVRIFAHADKSGLSAEARWWSQLEEAGARVDAYDFASFVTADGQSVNDLNDFVRVSPDQWEAEREAIGEALSFSP